MKPKPATNNPITNDSDDVGEFAALTTLHMLAAFLFAKHGEDFLRQALAPDPDPEPNEAGIGPREHLENAAEQLEARGLDHVAAILRDLAEDAISGLDLPPSHWSDNAEIWRTKWLLRRKVESGELERELRRNHARKQRQSQ